MTGSMDESLAAGLAGRLRELAQGPRQGAPLSAAAQLLLSASIGLEDAEPVRPVQILRQLHGLESLASGGAHPPWVGIDDPSLAAQCTAAALVLAEQTPEAPTDASRAVVVGTGLALLACDEAAAEDVAWAVALGLEVQRLLEHAVTPAWEAYGWSPATVCGVLAASATVGIVLDLDRDRLADAIGVAASSTLGLAAAHGDLATFAVARAAGNSVLAAWLARAGVTASATALEGPRGYFQVLCPGASISFIPDELAASWSARGGPRPTVIRPGRSALASVAPSPVVEALSRVAAADAS